MSEIHNTFISEIIKASIDDLENLILPEIRDANFPDARREQVTIEVKIRFEELGIKVTLAQTRKMTKRSHENMMMRRAEERRAIYRKKRKLPVIIEGVNEAKELLSEGGKYFNETVVVSRWFFKALEHKHPELSTISVVNKSHILTSMGFKRSAIVYLDGLAVTPWVKPGELETNSTIDIIRDALNIE